MGNRCDKTGCEPTRSRQGVAATAKPVRCREEKCLNLGRLRADGAVRDAPWPVVGATRRSRRGMTEAKPAS